MDITTQAQKLWHMAFSRRLAMVTDYTVSSLYWEHTADTIRKQRGESEESIGARQAEARTKAQGMRAKTRDAENAFCEWVMAHAYPAEEA